MLIDKEKAKEKKWILKSTDTPESEAAYGEIAKGLGINPIVAKLLYNRGYTDVSSASRFIRMENEIFCNPFDMKDMDRAVQRIETALKNREKITVYGDYDVDGVTSVCTLYLYLKSCGADVDYYIPNRAGEGYGVSASAIDMLKARGTNLIITVDTGVTANEEIEYAKGIGIDFVVTDHHECRDLLPCADAVVNPHRQDCGYAFKELAGVGVVFKLLCAHCAAAKNISQFKATYEIVTKYADLVAIGTIADVMPIVEENRLIVKYGLNMIQNTERVGLAALIDASVGRTDSRRNERYGKKAKKTKITSGFIGFTLAPRINAAGRVRSASMAVELFLSDDAAHAKEIAEQLCEANRERQAEENKIMQEAYRKIDAIDINKNPVIVLDADDWHHGVIGIVSSRITEKFSRPSILVSFDGNESVTPSPDDMGKGSGRSIKGLNLVDALYHCSDCLSKFGGHELAAGLSVTRENLPIFREKINAYARETLTEDDMVPTIESDCKIGFSDLSLQLATQLQQLEPYGVGNPIPIFVMNGVNIVEIGGVSDGKHSKLILGDGNSTVVAMYFSNSPNSLSLYVGDKVDVLFSIDINEWMDKKNVQLIIRDIRPTELPGSSNKSERARFDEIRTGATFTRGEDVLPDREDFVSVYNFINMTAHEGGTDTFSHKDLMAKLGKVRDSRKIGYIKLKFIIMIFRELNLIEIDELSDEVYKFTIHYSTTKKNLDKSSILRKLRSQLR